MARSPRVDLHNQGVGVGRIRKVVISPNSLARGREMKLTVVLSVLIGMLVLACSTAAPAPVEPTPNIDATVEAKLAQERAVDATAQAKTLSTTQASCKLTGGETVESGWTGEDTGDNSCNSCFCTNGALGCTKMACPAHLVNSDSEPSPTRKPTNTPTAVPNPTSVPTPTPRPLPTVTPTPAPTPIPTSTPVYSSCAGKTIRFKIGNVWANESIVWTQGGGDTLNLTASSASLPPSNSNTWPISASAQRIPPHVVVGSVNAADGTSISAWDGDTQIATTSVAGGSYTLIIEKEQCVSTSVSTGTNSKVAPPTKFEGGSVMFLAQDFKITGEIAFKIGQYVAEQTVTLHTFGAGEMQLLDLYATSMDSEVPYTEQTGYEGRVTSPPNVIAGRAYIDGEYAPDGTVVTAWIGGEEIVEFRTTVINNPVALVPTELVSILETLIPPPSPLPTPCPKYMDCGQQYYSGRLSDDIEVIWDSTNWKFYSPDPAWRLANNYSEVISSSCWINAKTYINFDKQANGLEGVTLFEGWNSGGCLE